MIETFADLVLERGGYDMLADQRAESINIENPSTAFDKALLAMGSGGATWAGRSVSVERAMQISAVFACVRLIASGIAMLDLDTRRRLDLRRNEAAPDHYLWRLLRDRVNPTMTAHRWKRLMATWVLLWGNAYSRLDMRSNGRVVAMYPLHPSRVKLRRGTYWVSDPEGGNEEAVLADEMLHLRGIETTESGLGLSVVTQARQSLGAALATEEYGARFFGQGASFGGFIKVPENLSDEAKHNLLAYIDRHNAGLTNVHRLGVLDGGMEFQAAMPMSMEDAQFLTTRQFQLGEVARWFGVPPHKIGDLSRATNNNIEHQSMEWVQDGLGPWLELFESEIASSLLSESESRSIYVRFRREELLQGDFLSRTKGWSTLVNGGLATPNEGRDDLGLNQNTDGDVLLANGTLTPVRVLAAKQSVDGKR